MSFELKWAIIASLIGLFIAYGLGIQIGYKRGIMVGRYEYFRKMLNAKYGIKEKEDSDAEF